jgi:hypothetical protein
MNGKDVEKSRLLIEKKSGYFLVGLARKRQKSQAE